jgi:hypothetical protein
MEGNMKTYEAKVYSGKIFVGYMKAKSMSALKRMASRKCNNYYSTVDSMFVHTLEDGLEYGGVHFYRMNIKAPNNTIVRGMWR